MVARAAGLSIALLVVACGASSGNHRTGSAGGTTRVATPARSATGPGATAAGSLGGGGAQAVQQSYASIIQRTLPSVVEIKTTRGLGSGVILDAGGNIVTNAHVVGSATSFTVLLANSTRAYPAKLVGIYQPDDIAVIKVDGTAPLRPAHFADSSKARIGDLVLAMGNPLGLASSVTQGIISATGRTVTEAAGPGQVGNTLPDVIQTSAAINPGNSGGALVALDGGVVGIPTLAALNTPDALNGDQSTAAGIGFAIPSSIARDIAGQLVRHGKVINSHRAAIGARVATVAKTNGQPAGVGIFETHPDGPAQRAGLAAGDVITSINGKATPDTETLASQLATLRTGQTVPVRITHTDGASVTLPVTLGELPVGG
ncbi:MAG: S1C family serine protease [Frankia sp.]